MPKSVSHALLKELKLRLTLYDLRVAKRSGPVSAEPVLEAARVLVANYTAVKSERGAYFSERTRQQREERKAQGLCRVCGKVPRRPERTTCPDCGAREVQQAKKQYEAMKERL